MALRASNEFVQAVELVVPAGLRELLESKDVYDKHDRGEHRRAPALLGVGGGPASCALSEWSSMTSPRPQFGWVVTCPPSMLPEHTSFSPGLGSGSIRAVRDRVPSIFLLVPGPWGEPGTVLSALAARGIDAGPLDDAPARAGGVRVDVVRDEALAQAFAWGRSGRLPEELLEQVAKCDHAALLEVSQRLDEDPERIAAIGRALRDAGGVAVRMEASGGASPWKPWLEQLQSGYPNRLYASAVIVVNDDEDTVFTCGMHHFDLPDAQIAMSHPAAAIDWLDTFCIYQLAEQPALASGHTFCPDADTPRRVLERWPDHRHHPDDGRHNPFGVWRFLPEGQLGLEAGKLVPTIMPSLVAMLINAERTAGRALSQAEVEEIVSNAPAMMIELEHAIALERSRGYADIEPELAWEQWQIVRETL
jgi:hypothetical protein